MQKIVFFPYSNSLYLLVKFTGVTLTLMHIAILQVTVKLCLAFFYHEDSSVKSM